MLFKKDNKVLMIKFTKKCAHFYAPSCGKFEVLENLKQFDQKNFSPYLFKDELFEGKFLIDNKCKVLDYKIREI